MRETTVTGVRDNQQPDDLEAGEGVYVTVPPPRRTALAAGHRQRGRNPGIRSGQVTPVDAREPVTPAEARKPVGSAGAQEPDGSVEAWEPGDPAEA